jgi:benzodiazapine receptor
MCNKTVKNEEIAAEKSIEVSKLNVYNYLNIIGYLINFLITFGVGTLGLTPGSMEIGDLSDKYQTIVSPNGSAFSIWGIIFIAQAIFAIGQLLPRYRSKAAVQDGLKYWYFLVCIFQALWTFFFSYELITLSLPSIALIWIFLLCAITSQYYCELERTHSEFWMMRFPFMIHCGWLTAATTLNTNVVIVNEAASASVQLTSGIISLAVLHAIAVVSLWLPKYPNYVIPSVLVWANFWIGKELQVPKDEIIDLFGDVIVNAIKNAAFGVSVIVLIQIFARAGLSMYKKRFEDNESISETTSELLVDTGLPTV